MKTPLSLSSLPESHLLAGLKNAVSEERKWTQLILEYLLECDRRGLHLKLGFASLHEFSVQYLGLSDGAAHRRIQSMRLMAGVPAVSEKIASGALTLSNAARLQTFFMAEKRSGGELTREEKQAWVEKSAALPSRELEREILKEASAPVRASLQERARDITPELKEIRFVISSQLCEQLEELKNCLSHSILDGSVAAIFERLVRQELERQRKKVAPVERVAKQQGFTHQEFSTKQEELAKQEGLTQAEEHEKAKKHQADLSNCTLNSDPTQPVRPAASAQKHPRFISAFVRREVWTRARGQCEANVRTESPDRFRRCSARRLLQIDHIKPISLGGENTLTNLRLLCAHHNRLRVQN